jgi:hypothetical protein
MTQDHEIVWIFESLHIGSHQLFSNVILNSANFFHVLMSVGRFPLFLLGAVVLLGFTLRAPITLIFAERRMTFTAIAVTTISCLFFFYLVGFYPERLAFNVVPPLILGAAVVALGIVEGTRPQSASAVVTCILWVIAISRIVLEIAKSGPYD